MCVSARAMLEIVCSFFGVSGGVIEKDCSGDILQVAPVYLDCQPSNNGRSKEQYIPSSTPRPILPIPSRYQVSCNYLECAQMQEAILWDSNGILYISANTYARHADLEFHAIAGVALWRSIKPHEEHVAGRKFPMPSNSIPTSAVRYAVQHWQSVGSEAQCRLQKCYLGCPSFSSSRLRSS